MEKIGVHIRNIQILKEIKETKVCIGKTKKSILKFCSLGEALLFLYSHSFPSFVCIIRKLENLLCCICLKGSYKANECRSSALELVEIG